MNDNYLLGIDIGTSGTRALIIDEDGNIISSAIKEYPLYTPKARVGGTKSRRLV